jgi:uroporphyrinogen III methyltransferase/synthase
VLHGTVGTIALRANEAELTAPLVTVVGDVARLGDELAWFEPGPLAGRQVVVTRARAQASALSARLEAAGAEVVEAPVLETRDRPEELVTDERVASRWDWIVFTSANGVDAFFNALDVAGRDARSLSTTKVASIGEATAAALRARGVRADFSPSKATSAVLAEELPRLQGARVLLPVSSRTDDRLAAGLRARGGLVEQVAAYETLAVPLDAELGDAVLGADAITFASASSADNLAAALEGMALNAATKLVSIGPETSTAVRRNFGRVDAEADHPSLDALVAALEGLSWA